MDPNRIADADPARLPAGPRFADARLLALAACIEASCPHDFSRPVLPVAALV